MIIAMIMLLFSTIVGLAFITLAIISHYEGWLTKYDLEKYARCKEYYDGICNDYNHQDKLIEIEFNDDDPSYYDDSNFETIFGKGE